MFTRLARWPGPSCGLAGQGRFGAGPALTGGMYAPVGPASRTTVANYSRRRRTRDKVPVAIKRGRGAHAAQQEERSMKVFVTTQDVATRRSEIVGEMTLEEFAARVQEVVQAKGRVTRVLRAAEA